MLFVLAVSVHLTNDLSRIVEDFAEHYHDSWALTQVRINV